MAVLPDGLGLLVEWAIKLSFMGDLAHAWTITGQAVRGTQWSYENAVQFIDGFALALRDVVFNPIYIHGGTVRRYVPRTIEPNPDPPVYNATNHVAYNGLHIGSRPLGAEEQMFYDQVWDINRLPEFGNIGRIEVRGALTEADVDETMLTKTLADPSAYTSIALAFNAAISELIGLFACDIVMAGEPLLSTVRTTVDNVHHDVRTFGETQVRTVFNWSGGGVRSDKGKSSWFNSNRVGG